MREQGWSICLGQKETRNYITLNFKGRFAMYPNHLEILRVYTRREGELVEDPTIHNVHDNEIVVEMEAGGTANAAFQPANSLELEVRTFDLNHASGNPTILASATFSINLNTEGQHINWVCEYKHPLKAATGLVAGHTYEIYARLSAPHQPPGTAVHTVSFAKWMFYVY